MRQIDSTIDIAAGPDRTWPFLADFEWWPQWGISISEVDSAASRIAPGVTGRVRTRFGVWLPFTIDDVVAESFWSWHVAGVPATEHHIELRGAHTRVRFAAPWVVAPYTAVMAASLRKLKRLVEAA